MSELLVDAALTSSIKARLGSRHPVFAAAVVTGSGVRLASKGADLDADFELASISKAITGLLYADSVSRAEIRPEQALGEVLPLGGVPAAGVRLESLSRHRSGLPRLPSSAHPWRRSIALMRHGTNPYGENLEELLTQARQVRVGRPRPLYSNFGFELLGHALASAAGTTYAELVRERIARPLGLSSVNVPVAPEQLRPQALTGRNAKGRPREPWTGEAIGPAGGIRASITDMASLTTALLDGTAPGLPALDPVAPLGITGRIGAAWITTKVAGREVTWHNGRSGGFASWLGLDRDASTGVVLLTATSASVDNAGMALLLAESGHA
ncbi:serine hydrolase domain-containing protein [Diaminobutyricimonas sp. TR449]|uniref:serine hydrolase domain-containing protein n=1 Tax=Diaminobutyricimonas sp. TR449 TaxID=2708076 RepID=UPI0014228450|nr:serine hydrolase domain-containing protein [Diaminobutyricimonas sp. TR449]